MARHPRDSVRRARAVNFWRPTVPPLPPGRGRARRARGLQVFATGTDFVQLSWRALGPGDVTVRAGDGPEVHVRADGGPGAVTVTGLPPGGDAGVVVSGPGVPSGPVRLPARTLPQPAGAWRYRFATVSDSHLGSTGTGYFHTIVEKPEPVVPHPERCLRAAVAAVAAAGAGTLVVKGDLVDASTDANWAVAGSVLGGLDLDVVLMAGNHERNDRSDLDAVDGARRHGLDLTGVPVRSVDLPGVRLVLVDTVRASSDTGHVDHARDAAAEAVRTAPGAAVVVLHHQPTATPVPTYLPPGIPGRASRRFLGAVGGARPDVLVLAGHTHRHRRRLQHGVTVAEVGATKDYPGTWAAYDVYDGGIVQTVRRIEEASCILWTDYTGRAAAGVWRRWSPGRLEDRCFVHPLAR